MKGDFLGVLVPSALIVLGATTAFAFIEPTGDRLADFDGRPASRGEPKPASTEQQAAASELRARLPGVKVDFDQLTGAPRFVSAGDGFLSGPTVPNQSPTVTSTATSTISTAAIVTSDPDLPARTFLQEHRRLFGHGPEVLDQARVVRAYVTPHNGMRTVVWQQQVDDIPVFEAVLVAHTTRRGELINLSSGFVPDPVQAADAGTSNRAAVVTTPPLTDRAAVVAAARDLGESITDTEVETVEGEAAGAEKKQLFQAQALPGQTSASLVWLPMGREEFRLCWDVVLTSRSRGEMFRILVDARTGEVLLRRGLTRYLSDASYRVYTSDSPSPFSPGHSTPLTTQPGLTNRFLVSLPAMDTNASPNGWINDGINQTLGNNVDAHTDRDNNDSPDLPRPAGSPFRVFDFSMDPSTQDPNSYTNAAVVQLFYLCNWYHDRLYELGFTEAAGNFQVNNFGRGGFGNDAVQADAQDGGGFNNANFSTPPDGSAGRMQMYIFSGPSPRRDGDFDAEIVFHEHTHGLSWRLVGGGQALGTTQSDGMGEGWSDFYGLTLLSEPGDNVNGCYAAGGYATYLLSGLTANYYYGIRRYPYSTDLTKNPLTFKDIDPAQASPHNGVPRSPIIGTTANEVHNEGEVWCVTLWEARANLVNKHGWAVGNELMLQLVTDGMKLTPGQPNFLQARDAILQADLVDTGGANRNELWSAFAKRGMGLSATSPASTTTTGLFEAYDVPDDLFVFPDLVLTSVGPVGGPFTPNPASFVLTNTGSAPLNWSLMNTSTWATLLPTSGTLVPGGPATTVAVTIGTVVTTFPLGYYMANLRFTNQTSAVVQARTFRLSIVGGSMFDDFDPDIDLTQWSDFGGSVGSTILANSYGGFISAPNSLWFGAAGSRYATTVPIDASGGGTISFWLRLGNSTSPWENVDLPGEGVVLEYSTNGGGSWVNIVTCDTSTYYSWTQVSNSIPVGARTSSTLFRWRQLANSGADFDHWALDDVMIDATPAAKLTLSLPTTATEGDPPQTGTVTVLPAPTDDLTVTLNSSDVSELTVPASVLVLAGTTNATFDITIVDDVILDGPQTATVTASAPAHQGANAVITVADNETATLSLSLPGNTSESSGAVTGIVSVSTAPAANILVSLSSSDTTELLVPATVLLSAGQTSAVFIATVVNDTLIDGPQNVTVTAHVANWTDGLASIIVLDDETVNLTVNLPATAYENAGVLVDAGQVRLSGSLPTNLVVSLLSSDTTEVIVPATTTVLAGQTNGVFNLTMVDDAVMDGAQSVRITASAPGFNSGSNTMSVLDDESPPLPTNPSPISWATNVAANTMLTWSNGLAGITNDVYFGTVAGAGQLQYLGSTTGTNWTLPLLAPNTTYYWRIVVNRVGTTIGPVWRFTTRGVDHFDWDTVASPQYVNAPFVTQLTAKDELGTTVSNFTETVNLSGLGGGGQTTNTILGNVTHTSTSSGNYTLAYAITPNTNLTVTHVRSYSGSKVSIWSDAGILLASQNVTGVAGTWTETPLAAPLTLTGGGTYRVSFYINGGTYYFRSDRPATFPDGTLVDGYYFRSGDGFPDSFFNSDKVIFLCDLRYTTEGSLEVPITPAVSGPFVNGTWTGNVTVLEPKSGLTLRAADESSHSGSSNPFEVMLANDVAVTVSDAPDPVSVGGNLTYAISVTNLGPASATGVIVTNVLPASTTIVSVTPSQGTTATNGNVLLCNLGTLAANASAMITIVGTATTIGSITNVATVYRAETDAFLGNNSATAVTAVVAPVLSVNSVSIAEGNSGTTPLVFTVSLSAPPATSVSVNFATTNISALAGSDYLATNGILNFAIGQTNRTFAVQILGDTNTESSETFAVVLSNPVNATLGTGVGTGTIFNDDAWGRVAVFGAPGLDSWNEDVRQKVAGAGNFSQVDAFSVKTGYPVPTLTQLQQYAAVLVYSDNAFNDNVALGDVLADYIDAGGGVVLCTFGFHSLGGLSIQGRIKTAGYLPFSTDEQNQGSALTLVADLPSHPILNGVSAFNGGSASYHNSSISIANAATLVAHWNNGQPLVGAKEIAPGRIVGLNFFPPSSAVSSDFWNTNTQGGLLMANALGWAAQSAPETSPPVIWQQPTGQAAYVSGTATFSVAASGSPLTYQWRKNGAGIASATNASHVISNVQTNDAGDYSVVVANAYGAITSSIAVLTVSPVAPLSVLLIWDTKSIGTPALSNALFNAGMAVTMSATDESGYTGNNPSPAGFGAIIHLNGTTYSADMPLGGQIALSNYVYSGGGYLHSEWDAYEFGNGAMSRMRDLILFDRTDGKNGTVDLTIVPGQAGHPVLSGLPTNFTFQAGYNVGPIHAFPTNPATVLMRDAEGSDAVAVRSFGAGRIVGFHNSGNYEIGSDFNTLTNPYVQQLYINGALWAAKVGGNSPAPLRFVSMGNIGGNLQFWLGTTDGSLIGSNRAARIQFLATTNFALPITSWLPLSNNLVLTNGLLGIELSDLTNSPIQFLRAKETP